MKTGQDFTVPAGDGMTVNFTIDADDGATLDGYQINWKAVPLNRVASEALAHTISKSLSNGVAVVDEDTRKFSITLDPADTEGMEGRYLHEAEIVDGQNTPTTVTQGVMTVLKTVN